MVKLRAYLAALLTVLSGTAIAQSNLFDMTDTWIDGGTEYDAIKMTVTDTASAADSRLLNLTATSGGIFQVAKDGSLTMTGTQFIAEQADAAADVAGYGQLWVNTATPNELWFTDDAGTDFQLGAGGWRVDDDTYRNYAHGYNALNSITSAGTDNVAIGYGAGQNFTTVDNNVVVGAGALDVASGLNTVAIGKDALGINSAGNLYSNDVFIGYQAGLTSQAGTDNSVFIGAGAGMNSDSSYSVIIGGYEAAQNATGDYNTFIGGYTTANTVTTASRSIVIGNGNLVSPTADSQLTIGNAIYGYQSASLDSDVTYGLRILGPSALPSASTNQDAGNLDLKMGDHAIGGGTAGNVSIVAPDGTVRFSVDEDGDFGGTTMLADVTAGNYAFGSLAGDSWVATAYDNVVVGSQAGTNIVLGDDNVMIGDLTGEGAADGSYNTFVGSEAGRQATGSYNTVLGVNAGSTALTENIAIGRLALRDATGNTYNIAIGTNTLNNADNADFNVVIGHEAGRAIGAAAGGDYKVLIGPYVAPLDDTSADQLVIGNGASKVAGFTGEAAIKGYMAARTDVDYSGKSLTISGPSAYASASINQDGGNLILQGGQKASGGGTDGNVVISGYSMPNADGAANQFLQTDGAGAVSWAEAGGGWNVEANNSLGHGTNALDALTTGVNIVAIGVNALTDGTDPDDSVAIGYNAGANTTVPDDNIFIGSQAGFTNITGNDNTFIGKDAGYFITGSGNTIFGAGAGSTKTSGNNSILIGRDAQGISNTASNLLTIGNGVGANALYGYMTATTDAAVGNLTLFGPSAYISAATNQNAGNLDLKMGNHATGGGTAGLVRILAPDDTVAFSIDEDGDIAGKTFIADLTNGNYAFGTTALDSITVGTGIDNIAIGENAGTSTTTAGSSVYIGTNAGQLVNGASNVFLGVSAGQGVATANGTGNIALSPGALAGIRYGDFNIALGVNSGDLISDGQYNVILNKDAGGALTTGSYNFIAGRASGTSIVTSSRNLILGNIVDAPDGDVDDQFVIGNWSTSVNAISGYFGAMTDVDYSAKDLTITGPSAWPSAAVNQNGGDLILRGGQKATGGGVSGDVLIQGLIYPNADGTVDQVMKTDGAGNITFGDAGGGWNVEDTTNGNYGHGLTALDSLIAGGVNNIAIGENAGTAITTGDDNVTIGNTAGINNSTGSFNVNVGNLSGNHLGTWNTSIGHLAGPSAGYANHNVVIGYGALTNSNGDSENVVIGSGAGENFDSGNVLIGYDTGAGYVGSYSTLIGHKVIGPVAGGTTTTYGLAIGTGYTSYFARGYMTALSDYDISSGVTIHGPSAFASAATNQNAGDLNLIMGDHATGGGIAGKVKVLNPAGTAMFTVDEVGDVDVYNLINGLRIETFGTRSIGLSTRTFTATGTESVYLVPSTISPSWTNASYNTYIGYEAGVATAGTRISNTLIGYKAGRSVDGDKTVVVGASSGEDVGTGTIVIGAESANTMYSAATENIVIGHYSAVNLTTGSYNILLGSVTNFPSTTDNDQLVIGNSAVSAVSGYMGARTDVDYSAKSLTITGPSAWASAATNQDGGDLILQGGQKASGGGSNGLTLVNDTVYAIMSVQAGVTSQDDIGSTPVIMTAWNTDGLANGATVSSTNDYITVDAAGVYEVIGNVSFTGTNSADVTLEIYIYDDSGTAWNASGFALERTLGAAAATGSAGLSGIVSLDTSDRVALYISTGAATDDVTVSEAQLQIKRISN